MPGRDYHPAVALVGAFDARPWAGVEVFRRGAAPIVLPALSALPSTYPDLLGWLNAWASGESLGELAQAALNASAFTKKGGRIEAGIDASDRVYLECDDYPIQVQGNAAAVVYGFPGTGPVNATGSGPYRVTAPADWIRGRLLTGHLFLTVEPAGENVTLIFGGSGWVQDVPTYLRGLTTPDAWSPSWAATCLTRLDGVASAASSTRWGLDAAGHVFCSRAAAVDPVTWTDHAFRRALGFSGEEIETASGTRRLLTAAHPPEAVLVPSRGLARRERGLVEDAHVQRFDDGSYAGVHRGSHERLHLDLVLDGPADMGGPGRRDHERHFLRWLRANPTGSRLTLYQHWGDSRRARANLEVDMSTPAYDVAHTSEWDGTRGRVPGWRGPGLEEHRTHYEHDIPTGAAVSLVLDVEA